MTATPGKNSATVEGVSDDQAPGTSRSGWPAPYAEGSVNPWVGELIKGLPLAVAVLDVDGCIIGGNDALEATIGKVAPGQRPEELLVEADRSRLAEIIAEVAGGRASHCEVRVTFLERLDEKQIVTVAPVPPGLGVAAMLGFRDVREQRRLEAQVQAATRMQAVGQLAGGIAHDFNNLLTAVLALSEQIIERAEVGSPDHEAASEISRNGRRAAALVAQLLAFARRQPQRPQLLDLAELLDGLRPLLVQLVGKGVQLEMPAPCTGLTVRADAGQIEQVIVNLSVNARDAMGGQGLLEIETYKLPAVGVAALGQPIMPTIDYAVIEVRDSGTGIPPAIAGRIFEPFFTTKKLGEGTGLGLSTVYGIVKQSDGFIFARPNQPRGTVFSVYLPAVLTEVPALPASEAAKAPMDLAGCRLLLVEDEASVRDVLVRGLRRQGLIVRAVGDAAAALEELEGESWFDVLLSDVMMPGMDGVELASRARALRPDMAVLLMSGFAELPLQRAAETAGIGFISKPFAMTELIDGLARAGAGRAS